MNIDANHLFFAKRSDLFRLARFVGMNPVGLTQHALVLGLLFRLHGAVR